MKTLGCAVAMPAHDDLLVDPVLGVVDTVPEMRAVLVEGFRSMSGRRKMACVAELNRQVLTMALGDIRRHHPAASERECLLRLATRCYRAEIVRSLCGWDAEMEGN